MSGSVYSDKYLEGHYALLERKLKLKTQKKIRSPELCLKLKKDGRFRQSKTI